MKVKVKGARSIKISGDFIKLDSLLKLANIASTGGEAKIIILSGDVYVGGEQCLIRGKKIHPGDLVRCRDSTIIVSSGGDA